MRPPRKPVSSTKPEVIVLWWRPWMWGLSCLLLCLLCSQPGFAQAERKRPARADASPKAIDQAPVRESENGGIPARKLEEALQLLLRADSLQSVRRKAVTTTEIASLVLDQTITKPGHDFYDLFYNTWEAPAGIEEFTITIGEKPGRVNSTLVTLRVNEEDLLEMPLQPNPELIEEAVADATAIAFDYLQQQRNLSRQLEKEDLGGSGIY